MHLSKQMKFYTIKMHGYQVHLTASSSSTLWAFRDSFKDSLLKMLSNSPSSQYVVIFPFPYKNFSYFAWINIYLATPSYPFDHEGWSWKLSNSSARMLFLNWYVSSLLKNDQYFFLKVRTFVLYISSILHRALNVINCHIKHNSLPISTKMLPGFNCKLNLCKTKCTSSFKESNQDLIQVWWTKRLC